MKLCPICRKEYVDDLSFCLDDGSPLVEQKPTVSGAETEKFQRADASRSQVTQIRSAPNQTGKQPRSHAFLIVVGLFLLGIVVLLGAGVGGAVWYFTQLRNERAVNIPFPANSPSPKPASSLDPNTNTPDVFGPEYTNTKNAESNRKPTPSPSPSPRKTPTPTIRDTDIDTDPTAPPDSEIYAPVDRNPRVPKVISGGVLNGKATSLPKPAYPPAARTVRASGAVSVQVLVDERGNVVSASAVSGHPLLRSAAVQAARGAKFSPTMLSGQAVKVSGVITYNFVP